MEDLSNIIMILDNNGDFRNLIYKYVRINIDDIRANTKCFNDHQTRKDQNYVHIYYFVSNPFTRAANLKIVEEVHK